MGCGSGIQFHECCCGPFLSGLKRGRRMLYSSAFFVLSPGPIVLGGGAYPQRTGAERQLVAAASDARDNGTKAREDWCQGVLA